MSTLIVRLQYNRFTLHDKSHFFLFGDGVTLPFLGMLTPTFPILSYYIRNGSTSSNWSYPVSNQTWNQSLSLGYTTYE